MTQRQRAFVQAYLECANASQAARKAGYSHKSAHVQGSRLLRNAKVSGEIERQTGEAARRSRVTVEWVLERLLCTYQEASERRRYPAAIHCLALLGKHLGMFGKRALPVVPMTDDERAARIKALLGLS